MSEEIIKLPLAPHSTEPDDVSLRSNSTGKSASSKTAKNVPHYLRASTGSCHDLCKYGRRQAFEEKPWRPMRRRIAAKPPPHIDGQSLAESEVLLSSRKKSPPVKLKPSSQNSSHVSDFHEIIKHEVLPKSHGSRRNSLGTEFVDDLKSVETEALSGMKKSARVSLNPSSGRQTRMSGSVDIIKQELSTKVPGSQTTIEDEVHGLAESEVLLSSRKKSPGVKLKSSSQTGSHVSDFHEIIKHEVLPKSHGSRRNSLGTEFVEDLMSVDSEALSGMKSSVRVSLNPSSDCQTHMSDSADIIKQEFTTKPPGTQTTIEDEVHDLVKIEVLSGENNLGTNLKPSCNSRTRRPASADIIKREESKNNRSSRNSKEPKLLSGRKQKTVSQQKSSDSKACFSNDSEITKHVLLSSRKLKVSSKAAPLKSSERSASLNIKPIAVEASASPDSSGISNSKSKIELKMGNRALASKVGVKKVQRSPASSSKVAVGKALASPRASTSKVKASPTVFVPPRPVVTRVTSSILRKRRSQKIGSSLKNHKNKKAETSLPDDEVVDKTLYVIKVDSERKCLETDNNDGHARLHPCPSSISNPRSSTSKEGVNKKEPRRTPRRTAIDGSEGKDSKSIKLNFQRGKLIDIQIETKSPRRLKYRRTRIVGENQNVKVNSQRRSFKQRGGEVECYNDCSQVGSEKVVLRHQDVVAKKDAQGLLNYLIEETASKLVETRKSKVKALVGAFESVISTKKPNL